MSLRVVLRVPYVYFISADHPWFVGNDLYCGGVRRITIDIPGPGWSGRFVFDCESKSVVVFDGRIFRLMVAIV